MKRLLFLIILFIGAVAVMTAQDDNTKREKRIKEVQEYKMKYLAQEMELSEVQKKKFFEIYEEMTSDKIACYAEAIKMDRELKHDKNASEENYQQVTQAFNKANEDWAILEKLYNEKFSDFLSQKQIYKMKEAENNFRSKFEEMKQARKKGHHK